MCTGCPNAGHISAEGSLRIKIRTESFHDAEIYRRIMVRRDFSIFSIEYRYYETSRPVLKAYQNSIEISLKKRFYR